MTTWTLAEALRSGRGNERPFRCHVHEDTNASASVNVLKGLWYCYACHARGKVDSKTVPSIAEIEAMLEPERGVRVYPESWLALFRPIDYAQSYWGQRFPEWLCWYADLGMDPFTGNATYPVRTPNGFLAGVCQRQEEGEPKYKYPPRWAASRTLHGMEHSPAGECITLVEGAADAMALWEVGIPALATYGAGLHFPQVEMVHRYNPRVVLTGFDMDPAGFRATELTLDLLGGDFDMESIHWPRKDPGDCTPEERVEAVSKAVGSEVYLPQYARWVTRKVDEYRANR